MPKPITEWGADEVRAVFAGLPAGSAIIRDKDSIVVVNVADARIDEAYEDGSGFFNALSPWPVRRQLICNINTRTESEAYSVRHTVPRSFSADERDVEEMRKHIQKVTEQAKKIGLF